MKSTYRKSWAGNLLMWSDLTFATSLKAKRGKSKLKVLIIHLFLVLEFYNVKLTNGKSSSEKSTYRKSWTGNRLTWSHSTFGPSL